MWRVASQISTALRVRPSRYICGDSRLFEKFEKQRLQQSQLSQPFTQRFYKSRRSRAEGLAALLPKQLPRVVLFAPYVCVRLLWRTFTGSYGLRVWRGEAHRRRPTNELYTAFSNVRECCTAREFVTGGENEKMKMRKKKKKKTTTRSTCALLYYPGRSISYRLTRDIPRTTPPLRSVDSWALLSKLRTAVNIIVQGTWNCCVHIYACTMLCCRCAGGRGSEYVGGACVSVHQHHQRDHA